MPNDEQVEVARCPKRESGRHCDCWYQGRPCCSCKDDPEIEKDA